MIPKIDSPYISTRLGMIGNSICVYTYSQFSNIVSPLCHLIGISPNRMSDTVVLNVQTFKATTGRGKIETK